MAVCLCMHAFLRLELFVIVQFLVPGYKPEGPIDSGLSVSQSVSQLVRQSVTAYLKYRLNDFSETWYEVGGPKYKKHSTAAFFFKFPVFSKTAHFL